MTKVQIYNYDDPVCFLNDTLAAIQKQNPQYSMRAWAKQLGINHVAMLSMVLSKKRKLLPSLSSRISRQFLQTGYFSDTEARYFDMLVLFSNAATLEEKNFYQSILSSIRPDRKFSTLELDHLRLISDWYHIAILEMTHLKDFNSDLQWITLRLGDSVNQRQVNEAIDRLLRLGLLERTPDGGLRKTSAHLATPSDIPSSSLRKLHSEMIQKAAIALEKQPLEKRDVTGHMMVIDSSKLQEAKRMIRDFRLKLAEFLETPRGDALYQVNVQLFDVLGGSHVEK
jgi:uncharacterized protein (TIGR02147 family)